MKSFYRLLVFGLLTLSACSSMSKDAKELMEKGDFQDAVGLWTKVLKENPNDEEAQRLLRVSQAELMNTDLVTFKGLLDSHQTLQAFAQLQTITQKRKDWNLGISPNSALYLKQQNERLYGQYLEMIAHENEVKHPLRALYLEKHYRGALLLEIAPEERTAKDQTQHEGTLQCDALDTHSQNEEHLRIYAIAFCKTFGKTLTLGKANEARLKDQLLKFPTFSTDLAEFTPSENDIVSHAILKTVQMAPEFSAVGSQSTTLKISGKFSQSQTQKTIDLSHSYLVPIPYIDYETVNNMESQPYSDSESHCDGKGNCWNETVTRYHLVDHFETLQKTSWRQEPRVYAFHGTELDQTIQFNFKSNLKSAILSLGLPFEDRFDEKVITHHENLPDIGLQPQPGKLTAKEDWLASELPKLSSAIADQLQETWMQKHCGNDAKLVQWKFADHLFDCLRSERASSQALVSNWFIAETGLEPAQTFEIIGPLRYL